MRRRRQHRNNNITDFGNFIRRFLYLGSHVGELIQHITVSEMGNRNVIVEFTFYTYIYKLKFIAQGQVLDLQIYQMFPFLPINTKKKQQKLHWSIYKLHRRLKYVTCRGRLTCIRPQLDYSPSLIPYFPVL